MDLAALNLLAIAAGAVLAFFAGAIWYGPLFGKTWQKEVGLSDQDVAGGMARTFGLSFLLMVVMSVGLALFLQVYGGDRVDLIFGLTHGLLAAVFFAITSVGINYLYQLKSLKLWLIDASYQILMLVIMGAVLGVWR